MTKAQIEKALFAYDEEYERWCFRYWDIKPPYGYQAVHNDEPDPDAIGDQTIIRLGSLHSRAQKKYANIVHSASLDAALAAITKRKKRNVRK